MKCPLDSRPVIIAELADAFGDIREIRPGHIQITEFNFLIRKPGLRWTTKIQNDLNQLTEFLPVLKFSNPPGYRLRQNFQEFLNVVGNVVLASREGSAFRQRLGVSAQISLRLLDWSRSHGA